MTNVRFFDLNNGDVAVYFGNTYMHIYNKATQAEQLADDIKAYQEDNDTTSWDNNEIEHLSLETIENDDTVEELVYIEDEGCLVYGR